jgi:hypothetical protein
VRQRVSRESALLGIEEEGGGRRSDRRERRGEGGREARNEGPPYGAHTVWARLVL